jgi:sulfur relay (sulfurtransferase) complex TusBCD TusD component (DsrE family)
MPSPTGRKLGILLSTGPGHPQLQGCLRLADAALAEGVEVYLYLIDDGVAAADDPGLQALAGRGARLFACAYGRQRRRLPLTGGVTYCGLVVLTDLLGGTDRFVAFG